MEIFKIPACWPSSFLHGIPLSDMLAKESISETKYKSIDKFKNVQIDNNLLDFIFQFCYVANLSRETAQATAYIFEYFTNTADIKNYDIQLIAMACILVCSKMHDVKPLSLSTLHRISAHIYNNQMVMNAEKIVLKISEYDLFIRDRLIIDRVGLYVEAIRFLIEAEDLEKLKDFCFKISDLIFEDMSIIKESDFNLLSAAIIQAAIVISIKRDGKLPITMKLSILCSYKEEEIMKLSKRIIKHCLGKNIYKKFTF